MAGEAPIGCPGGVELAGPLGWPNLCVMSWWRQVCAARGAANKFNQSVAVSRVAQGAR